MGISHEWHGSVLTITSDSGTSSADLRGEKGDTGIRGPQGVAGIITDTTGNIELGGYEKTENKVDDLTVGDEELEGKYPSALAVKNFTGGGGSANPLVKKVEDTGIVGIKDISPAPHIVKVKAVAEGDSENLIKEYYSGAFGSNTTVNGVDYVVDDTGVITANGTRNNGYDMPFFIAPPPMYNEEQAIKMEKGATYTVKCLTTQGSNSTYCAWVQIYDDAAAMTILENKDFGEGVTITAPNDDGEYYITLYIEFRDGYVANNITFKPEITKVVDDATCGFKVCGKNLLSVNEVSFLQSQRVDIEPIQAGTYLFSGYFTTDATNYSQTAFYIYGKDGEVVGAETPYKSGDGYIRRKITLTDTAYAIQFYVTTNYNASAGYTGTWKDLQIEKDMATAFEPYKNPISYEAGVSEIASVSPSMSIIADKDDAIVTVEYEKDINLAANDMELLFSYDFTGTETTSSMYVKYDKDGKPFVLDEMFVTYYLGVAQATAATTSYSIYVNELIGNGKPVCYLNGIKANTRYFQCYTKRVGKNRWLVQHFKNGYVPNTYNADWACGYDVNLDYINSIKLNIGDAIPKTEDNKNPLPAGTKVRVYGRRVMR